MPSASSSEILHFTTKNDLQNISHTFGVHRHQTLHKNDADSVAAWVEHTRQQTSTQNLVRYIKHQGDQSHYKLKDEEFVMVIASDAQLIGAKQFCGPGRDPCMDSTHVMNNYDFQLTTVLAIDEHGKGFPVAFCYSSHVDEANVN